MPALALERVAGCAPRGTLVRCLDSVHTTAEECTTSPTTSRSGSCGSRRSRTFRGRRSPAASGPIATPFGVGLKAGSDPTASTGGRWQLELAESLGLGSIFTN